MTPLFIAWLLLVGVGVGVMATLTYQKLKVRVRRVELDDYTARLRALDRHPLLGLQEKGMAHVPGVEPPPTTDPSTIDTLLSSTRKIP